MHRRRRYTDFGLHSTSIVPTADRVRIQLLVHLRRLLQYNKMLERRVGSRELRSILPRWSLRFRRGLYWSTADAADDGRRDVFSRGDQRRRHMRERFRRRDHSRAFAHRCCGLLRQHPSQRADACPDSTDARAHASSDAADFGTNACAHGCTHCRSDACSFSGAITRADARANRVTDTGADGGAERRAELRADERADYGADREPDGAAYACAYTNSDEWTHKCADPRSFSSADGFAYARANCASYAFADGAAERHADFRADERANHLTDREPDACAKSGQHNQRHQRHHPNASTDTPYRRPDARANFSALRRALPCTDVHSDCSNTRSYRIPITSTNSFAHNFTKHCTNDSTDPGAHYAANTGANDITHIRADSFADLYADSADRCADTGADARAVSRADAGSVGRAVGHTDFASNDCADLGSDFGSDTGAVGRAVGRPDTFADSLERQRRSLRSAVESVQPWRLGRVVRK